MEPVSLVKIAGTYGDIEIRKASQIEPDDTGVS